MKSDLDKTTVEDVTLRSFLTFKLENEQFAINVAKVIEIMEVPPITKVPKSPDFMKGVINLRGNVLPVIDTRIKFGLSPIEFKIDTCILVMQIQLDEDSIYVGALVDHVQEVLEIDQDQIQPSPSIGSKYKAEFIQGMINAGGRFIMLLNIDKVFSELELESIMVAEPELVNEKEENDQN